MNELLICITFALLNYLMDFFVKNNKETNANNINIDYQDYKKEFFNRMLYGIFMGVSDGIPGYSGGTTLSLIGFYETLIIRLKLIFKKNSFSNWFKNILWLLPFLIFWVGSIFAFSYLSEFIVSSGYVIPLIFLFFSFSFFCIPIFFYKNIWSKGFFFIYLNFKSIKQKNNLVTTIWFLIGILIILTISLIIFFTGGISLIPVNNQNARIDFGIEWLWICLSAFLAGFCMLIPGISGESIFYMTNYYDEVFWNVLQNPLTNIYLLLLIIICVVIGIALSIVTTSFLLKKFTKNFLYFCLGLVCMSPISILLGLFGNSDYLQKFINMFINDFDSLGLTILTIFIGFILNLFLLLKTKLKLKEIKFNKNSVLIMDEQFFSNSKKLFTAQRKIYKSAYKQKCKIFYSSNNQYYEKKWIKKSSYSQKDFEQLLLNFFADYSFYLTSKQNYLLYKNKNITKKIYQIF